MFDDTMIQMLVFIVHGPVSYFTGPTNDGFVETMFHMVMRKNFLQQGRNRSMRVLTIVPEMLM